MNRIKTLITEEFNADSTESDDEIIIPAMELYGDNSYYIPDESSNTENAITTCSDVLHGLEEFETTLEAILMDGGIDPQATVMLNTAFNVIHTTTGLPLSICMPSTEAYEDKNVKVIVTEGFLQTVKNNASRAWDAICKFIAKIVSQLNVFYVKYFDETVKTLNVTQRLLNVVSKDPGKYTKKEITLPLNNCNQLSKDYDTTVNGINALTVELEEAMIDNSYGESLLDSVNLIKELFSSDDVIGGIKLVTEKDMKFWEFNQEKILRKLLRTLNFTANDTKTIIGGCNIRLTLVKPNKDTKGYLTFSTVIENSDPYPEKSLALTKDEITKLLTDSIKLLKVVVSVKNKTLARLLLISKIRSNAMIAWSNLTNFNKQHKMDPAQYAKLKNYIFSFQYTYKFINEPGTTYQKQALRVSRAVFNLCSLSHQCNLKSDIVFNYVGS